ncbi:MAG: sulfurtransferase [Chloroflexi bacterium]|nr:sulfurtransferase [Chloroflexota bacterium]
MSDKGYAHPEVLVSTEWLAEHLHDKSIRVLEIDVDPTNYAKGHIPGAVGFDWFKDLEDPIRRDLVSKSDFERLLGRAGITPSTRVVLYGDSSNWFATWAFWIFKYYGHDNVQVVDGGRQKWIEEGRPQTTDVPQVETVQYTAKEPNKDIRAFRQFVYDSLHNPQRGLVDVRSPAEFSGEVLSPPGLSETAQRGGHIPGAANIPWAQATRPDGTFKSAEELRELYQGRGITPDKEIITYCRIGERGSHTWFVLKYLLGYDKVRNYDGSWTEWGSVIDHPINRGPNP